MKAENFQSLVTNFRFNIVDNLKTCFIYEEKGSWYNLSGNAFKQKALLKLGSVMNKHH